MQGVGIAAAFAPWPRYGDGRPLLPGDRAVLCGRDVEVRSVEAGYGNDGESLCTVRCVSGDELYIRDEGTVCTRSPHVTSDGCPIYPRTIMWLEGSMRVTVTVPADEGCEVALSNGERKVFNGSRLSLEPRFPEDANDVHGEAVDGPCRYFEWAGNPSGCETCPSNAGGRRELCVKAMLKDAASRIDAAMSYKSKHIG